MELKEKELFEYIRCPLRYQFVSKGLNLGTDRTFKKLAYSAINSYYSTKTNEMKADSTTLKRKWDLIASQNSDILNPKKILEGWGLLYRAYEYVEYNKINFMDINMPYKIEIPGTKVCLTGQLDPLIDREDHIEIFITSFDKTMPDRIEIDSRLKHTIDAYVINKLFKKDVVINYYVPALGKSIQTLRSTKDFERLESIIKNIGIALDNNIIYPRETFMCSSCLGRDLCKSWTGNNDGGE